MGSLLGPLKFPSKGVFFTFSMLLCLKLCPVYLRYLLCYHGITKL
jgi:hypothetical protein